MGDVVYLRTKPVRKPVSDYGTYCCNHCHRDFFRISADGSVTCYTCNRRIHNLTINDASSKT